MPNAFHIDLVKNFEIYSSVLKLFDAIKMSGERAKPFS